MYDSVVEHKCEMVNITVPQRDCDQVDNVVTETQCRLATEMVLEPVCVNIMDKQVEEVRFYQSQPIIKERNKRKWNETVHFMSG